REGFKGDQYRAKTEGMTGDQKREDEKMNYICRDNLVRYVYEGGGIMGAHAACDAMDCKDNKHKVDEKMPEFIKILKESEAWDDAKDEEKFPAYPVMMGGRFAGHPWGAGNKPETFIIEDPNNPIVKGIWQENSFSLQDEIYTFIEAYGYDRNKQRILISIDYDKSPLNDGADPMTRTNRKNKDFGLVWVKDFGKGRIFYGAFGHRKDVYYRNPEVCEMYVRGLLYATGDLKLKKDQTKPLGDKKNPYLGK
ncbi:MAG: ThuA domain-containing protein, partial [Opitutales bacterium]|nr:ThuA domain-containing protein [Opitutales bacterium]